MDYSPWSSKNLIVWNRPKKFMQVRIDELCMYTDFGGRGLSSFGVMAPFCLPSKRLKLPFGPWTIIVHEIIFLTLYPIVIFCIISHTYF